jgi:GT2 family glycosyltransferase
MPDVSVVIPARNGEHSLPPLLESLTAQTLPANRFEVIVVENGSTDRTAAVAAAHGARVVREHFANRSHARNAGVRAARAQAIAFTDADCIASPTWLEEMLAARGRAPLLAGEVETATGDPPNAIERFESIWRFAQEAFAAQGWAATANLFTERDAFEAVGGFDTTYRHIAEDADFCLRAGRAGFPIGYCGSAIVTHAAERELAPLVRRAFFHGYSSLQALRRLGVGHAAWREPLPLISPRAALAQIGVDSGSLPPSERRRLGAIAMLAYASRYAGSVWAVVKHAH